MSDAEDTPETRMARLILALERHARQAQEAGRVRRGGEALGEGRLHQVEIGLGCLGWGCVVPVRQMRRLPLRRPVRLGVVARTRPVTVAGRVVMVVHQKLTGRSIRCLWLPSLPFATIAPSTSTTTRVPSSAVMSEVS